MSRSDVLDRLAAGRVLAVVRTQELPDARNLCKALVRGAYLRWS